MARSSSAIGVRAEREHGPGDDVTVLGTRQVCRDVQRGLRARCRCAIPVNIDTGVISIRRPIGLSLG